MPFTKKLRTTLGNGISFCPGYSHQKVNKNMMEDSTVD